MVLRPTLLFFVIDYNVSLTENTNFPAPFNAAVTSERTDVDNQFEQLTVTGIQFSYLTTYVSTTDITPHSVHYHSSLLDYFAKMIYLRTSASRNRHLVRTLPVVALAQQS